ncbi:MAG: PAS domain S-box protein, partial [Thiovulaceae bacterium]|nr:PAS domain S-box protein [Sulfurimonadaceae bacterium]
PEKLVMLFDSFDYLMVLDVIDTIVTFAILVTVMFGLFGRQHVQLQNELDQFLRLKFDAKRLEENVHRQNAHMALIGVVSRIKKLLIESSTKDEIFAHVCQLLGKIPYYKVVWIGLQRQESKIIDIACRADSAKPSYLSKNFYVNLDDEDPHSSGPVGECMRTGRSVLIEDTQSDPRFEPWKRLAKISSIHSVLSIPMKSFNQEKLFGVISIYGDAVHRFSYEEINIIEELIRNISSAIAYHEAENCRIATEYELRNSTQLLQNIISTLPARIFWKDTQLRYLGCNELFLQDANITNINALIGKNDSELIWAENATAYNKDDLQVMRTKTPVVNRVERQGEMWVLTNKAPLFDDEHEIIGIIGSYIDITLQQRAKLYFKENEKRFRELLNSLPNISIQGYDKEHKVIYWNRQSELLYGYSESEALGKKFEELIIPDTMRNEVIAAVDNWILNDEPIPAAEVILRKKDGSDILVYSTHVLLQSQKNGPEMFNIDIDLTQQKEAEQTLYHLANYDVLTELPNRHFLLR